MKIPQALTRPFSGSPGEHLGRAVRVALIILWLCTLSNTDSYFICYAVIAGAASILTVKGSEYTMPGSLRWAVSCVFSAAVFSANYRLFIPDAVSGNALLTCITDGIFCLAGGIAASMPVVQWFWQHYHSFGGEKAVPGPQNRSGRSFLRFFCILLPIYLLNLFLVEYPGTLTPDPMAQIREMVTGCYSNFNSFYHTMLFKAILTLGYSLFGSANAAVATFCTFQVLLVCAAFAWCLATLDAVRVPRRWLVTAALVYALMPYHLALSVSVWKDTLFGIGCLLLCTGLFRILRGIGSGPVNLTGYALGCLLFCLARNIGVYACLVCLLFMLIWLRKHKSLVFTTGCIVLLCLILNGPALGLLGAAGADYVEFISVPLQQICRVLAEGCSLTAEETALLSRVLDPVKAAAIYDPGFSDPVKNLFRSTDPEYFFRNVPEYLELWLRLGLRYPLQYAAAWIDQTKGYWNGGYGQELFSRVIMDNPYGIFKTSHSGLPFLVSRIWYAAFDHLTVLKPLHSIGLHSWAVGLIALIQAARKNKEWILCVPILAILLGLILGSPVSCEFRYAYPMFACFPLILTAFFQTPDKDT